MLSSTTGDNMPSELAIRLTRFFEDVDPWGFRDCLEFEETVEDGIQRFAEETQQYIDNGDIKHIIEELRDVEGYIRDDQLDECRALIAELTMISEHR